MKSAEKLQRLTVMMNLSRLAKSAGVNRQTLGRAIKGKQFLPVDSSVKIARTLGVDVGWLIDDAEDWPPRRNEPLLGSKTENCDRVGTAA